MRCRNCCGDPNDCDDVDDLSQFCCLGWIRDDGYMDENDICESCKKTRRKQAIAHWFAMRKWKLRYYMHKLKLLS